MTQHRNHIIQLGLILSQECSQELLVVPAQQLQLQQRHLRQPQDRPQLPGLWRGAGAAQRPSWRDELLRHADRQPRRRLPQGASQGRWSEAVTAAAAAAAPGSAAAASPVPDLPALRLRQGGRQPDSCPAEDELPLRRPVTRCRRRRPRTGRCVRRAATADGPPLPPRPALAHGAAERDRE